jgi:hypothetical protein
VLGVESFNLPELRACPSCGVFLQAEIFPALFRTEKSAGVGQAALGGESTCFYHPEKIAAVVCAACGRFLCALCDIEFADQHLCPGCLNAGKQKGKIDRLQNSRTRHDRIALTLAVLPLLLFFYPTLIFSPIALGYALWHWKSPASLAPSRPRLNLWLAVVLASLQVLGWIIFFVTLWLKK